MVGHGDPVPASRTPHTWRSRWTPSQEGRIKRVSLLRRGEASLPAAGRLRRGRRGRRLRGARRARRAAATRQPPDGACSRGRSCSRRPGRALGTAPPPLSLPSSSLPLLRRRRRRRRGGRGRGRGGGSYCGERRAASGSGGGGLQQLTQEGAGVARCPGARPARRGSARSAPALVHCERRAAGWRAGRASTTAVPPPPDARAPAPSGRGNKAGRSTPSYAGTAADLAAGRIA